MRIRLYRVAALFLVLVLAMALSAAAEEEEAAKSAEAGEELKEIIEEEIENAEEAVEEETEKKVYYEDIVRMGEPLTVDEDEIVKGDVVCIGGPLTIAGTVRGDAVCVGGMLKLNPTAVIKGDAVAVGGTIDRDDGAVVEGESVSIGIPILPGLLGVNVSPKISRVARASASPFPVLFGLFLFVLVIAVLVSAFLPGPTNRVETTVRRSFWKAFLVGLLGEVLVLPLFLLLVVSIVGLALVPLAAIALAAAFYFGVTGVSLLVGNMFFSKFRSRLPHIVGSTAMGVLLIYALWIVGGIIAYGVGALGSLIVMLGCLVVWVVWTSGLGGVILTRFGSRLPADLGSESGAGAIESS